MRFKTDINIHVAAYVQGDRIFTIFMLCIKVLQIQSVIAPYGKYALWKVQVCGYQ